MLAEQMFGAGDICRHFEYQKKISFNVACHVAAKSNTGGRAKPIMISIRRGMRWSCSTFAHESFVI